MTQCKLFSSGLGIMRPAKLLAALDTTQVRLFRQV